jgi:hypothetical protein
MVNFAKTGMSDPFLGSKPAGIFSDADLIFQQLIVAW